MGCWNGTCAVSHMPIEAGDPVVGFLLVQAKNGSTGFHGQVDPGDVWQAITLPFAGEYDDYGGVENVTSLLGDFSSGTRVPAIPAVVSGMPGTRGAEMKTAPGGMSVPEALKAAQDGEDPIADLGGHYGVSPLKLMLVHRELWDALSSQAEPPVGDTLHLGPELDRVGEFLDAARSIGLLPAPGTSADPYSFKRVEEAAEAWCDRTGRKMWEAPYVWRFFTNAGPRGIHPSLRRHVERDLLPDAVNRGGDALRDLFEVTLRTSMFDANMGTLRRTWSPQAGAGSQNLDYEVHAKVAKWVDERAATLTSDDHLSM